MTKQPHLLLPLASALAALAAAAPQTAEPAPLPDDLPAGLVIEDGAAQPVPAFSGRNNWIQEALWVETEFDSDGDGLRDRVYVDVTRPRATEGGKVKLAAIYETSPYYWGVAGFGTEFFWDPRHDLGEAPPERKPAPDIGPQKERLLNSNSYIGTFVRRGFAVVHSASPGTGPSDGCPTIGADNESLAPKAVIDWLNGRAKGYDARRGGNEVVCDWCTGKVGMIGTSFNGTLPIAAATTGVEGLETIVPVAPNTSYYHYYRSNGLVRHPGGYMGEDIDVLYDFVNSGDPERRGWCNQTVRDGEMAKNQDRVTGDYNDWWAGRDYLNDLGGVRCSLLMAHGFNDWNVMPEHSFRVREALKARGLETICYYHQRGHGGDPPTDLLMRWFTRYLYGVENGVEDGPRAYIVREDAKGNVPTAYADYPNPAAEPVTLHLAGEGNAVGRLVLGEGADAAQTVVDDASVDGAALASAAASPHRLLFSTPELLRPVHFSGLYRVRLRLAADAPAANLSVWLVSLPWTDGASINENIISRGWADPQNAASIRESKPLVPGEFVELAFDLQPDDQIIPVGARVGLMVFSSDADFTLKPAPGTKLTFDLEGCSIDLPVVGGEPAWRAAFEL